jgi:hypothetical protein
VLPDLGIVGELLRAAVKIVRRGDAFDIYWKAEGSDYERIVPESDPTCDATVCLPGLGDTVDLGFSGHANRRPGTAPKSFVLNAKRITGAIEDTFDNELLAIDREPPFECAASSAGWCLENGDEVSFFEGTDGNLRIALASKRSELEARRFTGPHVALEALADGGDATWSGTRFDVEARLRVHRLDQGGEGAYLVARRSGTFDWTGVRLGMGEHGPRIAGLQNTASGLVTVAEQALEGAGWISLRIRREGEVVSFFYREEGETCWRGLGTSRLLEEEGEAISFHLAAGCKRCTGDLVADFDYLRATEDTEVCR